MDDQIWKPEKSSNLKCGGIWTKKKLLMDKFERGDSFMGNSPEN